MAAKDDRDRCQHCAKVLHPKRTVWLEYNLCADTWHAESDPQPPEESQGCFPFGKRCAARVLGGETPASWGA